MEDFRFQNNAYLLLLLLLPLAAWAVFRVKQHANEQLKKFVSPADLLRLLGGATDGRHKRKLTAFWLGLAFLALALARPQANPVVEELENASLDIYVLLDVSRSMDAEDVPPSRLKKAKRSIQSLMSLMAGDRLGVIAFAGSAVIVSPLTSDYDVVQTFLQAVDTNLIQNQSTNLGAALEVAEQAMKRGAERSGEQGPRTNVFVVMSDGEEQGNTDWAVAEKIHADGGTIFSIAFGTETGAKIPTRNDRGELMGYKRERNGNEVISQVRTEGLREVARRGAGEFYFSTAGEDEIRDIIARMKDMQRSGAAGVRARMYQEFFLLPLAIGILLLAYSFLPLRNLGGAWRAWRSSRAGAVALLPFFFVPGAEAAPLSFLWDGAHRASERSQELAREGKPAEAVEVLKGRLADAPDDPALNYNIGTYLLESKQEEEGRKQLERLRSSGRGLQQEALFNMAGSWGRAGKKPEARAAYAELLSRLAAEPNKSARELEIERLTKLNLARLADESKNSSPEQKQSGGGGGEGNEQKKDPSSGEGKSGDDKKPEKKEEPKAGENGEQKKDPPGSEKDTPPKSEQGNDQEKKPEKGDGQPQQTMRRGRQPFKERENLGEQEAKQILEALKLRETGLQKKFLKKKEKEGKVSDDGSGKDW